MFPQVAKRPAKVTPGNSQPCRGLEATDAPLIDYGRPHMIRRDGTEEYPRGRPDRLAWETPDGRRWYYPGRPDRLEMEDPDGGRGARPGGGGGQRGRPPGWGGGAPAGGGGGAGGGPPRQAGVRVPRRDAD